MTLRWSVYSEAVNDIRDEEALNDCFADLIDDTLTRGPGFLNYLFDDLVKFESGAQIEGTDRETLPDVDGSTVRIDLTVGDDSKIVGFESKRRDNLSEGQLRSELEKLEHNADGRDVILVAVTENLSEPGLISAFSDRVRWTSWFRIAQHSFAADLADDTWDPTVSRANKMFREFGYNEFDGIDTEDFNICVWELWKQTATQMEGIDTGTRWPYKMLREAAGTSKGYRPVDPDWMILNFNNPNKRPSETSYTLLSNKKTNEVWAGVATHPNHKEDVRETLCENAEQLADEVIEEGLDVIQFPLNWLVGRKNLPERHRKNVRAKRPETRDELVEAFTDRKGMENDGANWFILGYPVDLANPLKESVDSLTHLQDLFGSQTDPSLEALLE
jgi:hypothetical protein